MIDYGRMIDRVVKALRKLSIDVDIRRGAKLADSDRSRLSQLDVPFPPQLQEAYEALGSGFRLLWAEGDRVHGFELPKVAQLVRETQANKNRQKRSWELFKKTLPSMPEKQRKLFEGATEYPYPFVRDPVLAKSTERRMTHWIRAIHWSNGDSIAIDCNEPTFPVVYDRLDWMDGGSGANGFPVSPSWAQFMNDWASVCFQSPLWWMDVLGKRGVRWGAREFRRKYHLRAPSRRY